MSQMRDGVDEFEFETLNVLLTASPYRASKNSSRPTAWPYVGVFDLLPVW